MNFKYYKIFLLVQIFFGIIYSCNNADKPISEVLNENMILNMDSVYLQSYFFDDIDKYTGELDTCECKIDNDTLLITVTQLGGWGGVSGLVIKKIRQDVYGYFEHNEENKEFSFDNKFDLPHIKVPKDFLKVEHTKDGNEVNGYIWFLSRPYFRNGRKTRDRFEGRFNCKLS